MNSNYLKAAAASWLRYDKNLNLIAFERGIGSGNPDVIAVDNKRFLIEVEVKISMSDFRADAKKYKWKIQDGGYRPEAIPRLFYYLVPKDLVDKVKPELKEGHGLLTLGRRRMQNGMPEVISVVAARANKLSKRLSFPNLARMVKHQSGTLCALAASQAIAYEEELIRTVDVSDLCTVDIEVKNAEP
jgi:hypothetical protein